MPLAEPAENLRVQKNKSRSDVFDELDISDMQGKSRRGMGVTLSAQGARFALQTGSTVALGRLLSPEDFGLVAMVTVITNFVALFKDAGLAQATVQRDRITNEQISTLFWINLAISFGLGLFIVALAPVVSWIYEDSRLTGLTIVLALPILISGFSLQHRALLQRTMRFMETSRADIFGLAFGVCVGIYGALWGWGVWALVGMQVGTVLGTTGILLSLVRWRPLSPARGTGVRDMLKFGVNLSSFNMVNYFARNSDNFLIGKFVGESALGHYSLAYRFLLVPLSQLNGPIASVLTPVMARLYQLPEQREALYLKYVRIVAFVTILPISFLVMFGEELVVLVMGTSWHFAGELFEVLAVALIFQPVSSLTGVLFISSGRTDAMFRWGVFASAITVFGFGVGIFWGAFGVATAYAATSLFLTLPCWWWACRICGLRFTRFLRAVGFPSTVGLMILGSALLWTRIYG